MFSRSRCTRNREKFMGEIHVLLLTAGGSSRMGQAKPLLPWGKKNLIDYQVDTLKQLGCQLRWSLVQPLKQSSVNAIFLKSIVLKIQIGKWAWEPLSPC